MTTLLALFFMPSFTTITEPHYKINNCYENSTNGIIKITGIKKSDYMYTEYYFIEGKWKSVDYLYNSFNTIEEVYKKETKCPSI